MPVVRHPLFRSTRVAVHDNVCSRSDPRISAETPPLEFHEIVFPRAGVWVRHRAKERIVVDARCSHFFARGDSHRVSHPGPCGDRNTGIVLPDESLIALVPRVHGSAAFSLPAVPVDEALYADHCALFARLHCRSADALELEERVLALVEAVLLRVARMRGRGASGETSLESRARHRDLAHAASALLAARYRERLGLDEVAAALGVSVHHLCRVFRAELGTSLHGYRRSLRVRTATCLLLETRLTLYDVAERSGFADRTELTRAFQRYLGQAPTALRRRLAEPTADQESPRPARGKP